MNGELLWAHKSIHWKESTHNNKGGKKEGQRTHTYTINSYIYT